MSPVIVTGGGNVSTDDGRELLTGDNVLSGGSVLLYVGVNVWTSDGSVLLVLVFAVIGLPVGAKAVPGNGELLVVVEDLLTDV